MTKIKKNEDWIRQKRDLISEEIKILNKKEPHFGVLGAKGNVDPLALKYHQLDVLGIIEACDADQIAEILQRETAKLCPVCQLAFEIEADPQCAADFVRFVSSLMLKSSISA